MAMNKPSKINKHNLCPGCGHGIVIRMIEEVLEEMGMENKQCAFLGVGCSCTAGPGMKIDKFQAAHGRAAATATAAKRVRPDLAMFTYQGDGDATVIGIAETLNAAYRNEKITAIIINNTNFGMTGGQMSWTTMPNQVTATSEHGRNCEMTGDPLHLPEMIANSFNVAYAARGSVHDAKHINQTKSMIKKAFEAQMNNEGYSVIEILSACPTNWHLSPLKSKERIENELLKEFPVGEFKSKKIGGI